MILAPFFIILFGGLDLGRPGREVWPRELVIREGWPRDVVIREGWSRDLRHEGRCRYIRREGRPRDLVKRPRQIRRSAQRPQAQAPRQSWRSDQGPGQM